ncbi:MAG: UDP-N-acetylmuramate dehydrogenase [Campylobacterales bacterium]|nr:UDP-N-acetylmuramate dehydrogenase [Campylobacterales bacterium]
MDDEYNDGLHKKNNKHDSRVFVLIKQIDFSKYSSLKIGTTLDVLIINEIDKYENYQIIGKANNLLISNTPKKPLAILSKNFDYIKIEDNFLKIGGATPTGKIFNFCKANNIKNFEFVGKLPGCLGGMIKMNAGMKSYEIFNNLVSIKTYQNEIEKENIDYGYRYCNIDEIIYEATFNIEFGFDYQLLDELEKMRLNQPKGHSAGSCFKNPPNNFAGRLLENVGLKGYKINGIGFSDIHANFLINYENATFEDAISMIDLAKNRVFEEFGVKLQAEIQIF